MKMQKNAGLALLANALWPLILLPVVIVILRRAVIDREERYLTAKFGEEYLQYKARFETVAAPWMETKRTRLIPPDRVDKSSVRNWSRSITPVSRRADTGVIGYG